ncbi:hypothetical protein BT63DRAFT_129491 [Microthyrium microscopicum]|uniref:HAUS augmin-like complex subunit 3 N-terminal domain-containing protein n=1 Tax=Microthyrium microscopicum TaxID=703497 RepID=A0A6A6TT30_9PEZI|nr:hypothetical protein BT63DRAFT_129491 [Microthyrium microscopicum]
MMNIQDYQARERLLAALKEREIPLGADDISWAFASPKTRDEMIVWVKEYLHDETLLSADEMQIYQELSHQNGPPSSDQLILNDAQLKAAISSLQTSTDLIEKHAETLEAQREALHALQRQTLERRSAAEADSPGSKRTLAGSLDFTVEDLVNSIEEEFSIATKQSAKAVSSLTSQISERLGADDQILAALSKLAPRTMPLSKEAVTVPTVDGWSRALASLREQDTKARIDTLINEAICDYMEEPGAANISDEDTNLEDLEAEVESLRSEIGSVMELVVGSDYRQPLVKAIRTNQKHSQSSQHEWLEYVLATLEHMVNQLEVISACSVDLRNHNSVLSEISSTFAELFEPNATSGSEKSASPLSKMQSARPGLASRADSKSASSNINLAEQVFRRFAIPGRVGAPALETATVASKARLHEQYASAATSTADVVNKAIDEQKKALQSALKQLYASTTYSSVQLLPEDVERDVQGLDDAINETVAALSSAENGNHDAVRRSIEKLKGRLQS